MLKNTYRILNIFAERPWKKFTLKEIKEISKSKSESYTYNSLNSFVKENILLKEKVGNVSVYSAKHNQKAIAYLSMASENNAWKKNHISVKIIENLISNIPAKCFTFLVTGSYAKQKQKANSDIDVVIFSEISPKRIYSELNYLCNMSIPKVHLYVFRWSEFLQMLINKNPNYGKEIAENNLIFAGAEPYYRILMQAVENGLTGGNISKQST